MCATYIGLGIRNGDIDVVPAAEILLVDRDIGNDVAIDTRNGWCET